MLTPPEALDAKKIQEHTREIIHNACRAADPILVEAPPSSGKTTSAYGLVEVADDPITYLAERKDLYEDAKCWADKQPEITAKAIPSPQRNCPTFRGKNDGERAKAEQLYNKGISGARIHYHEEVHTPCHSAEDTCEYMKRREEINTGLKNENIDFLIGNHKHSLNSKYIEDRIVVFDEFNPSPFRESFPSEGEIRDSDHPGNIVPYFLTQLDKHEEPFPTETYRDITDILLKRNERKPLREALEWFEQYGVSRDAVKDLDFYEVSTHRYDSAHRLAPLLTLGLLCMRKVGNGIEVAPPPDEYDLPKVREVWETSTPKGEIRCVHDRNTGEMFVLRPPDLSTACQVIALDGLPSKRLWDLIFATNSEFEHRKIIARDHFSQYLSSALNMTVNQIGSGRYPYAGGRISNHDKLRFGVIKTVEAKSFALISTKKAIEEYESRGWLDQFVKQAPDELDTEDEERDLAVMNYATVVSSNAFEKEDLGVVSGSPFPGYQAMRIWTGLCREGMEIPSRGDKSLPSFEGAADDVYKYLNQHQVIQAILRFGRHEEVWGGSGSTVYVNTTSLPEWFEPDVEITIETETKRTDIIEYLIKGKWSDGKEILPEQNVRSIHCEFEYTRKYINETLNLLEENNLITNVGRGKNNSILYKWAGDDNIKNIDSSIDKTHLLAINNKFYLLTIPDVTN